MIGLTDFITHVRWEESFTLWFVLVDDAYQALEGVWGRWRRRGPRPQFSDSEVITVGLIIDTWFDGDEATGLAFVRQYHLGLFPRLPSAGQFNARRRALRLIMEQVRRRLLGHFGLIDPDDQVRVVDSAPIVACQYGRAARCRSLSGPEYVGWLSSKKARCFGFRLQATMTTDQVIDDWLLAPAGRKDGKMTLPLLEDRYALEVIADNAYHDPGESWVLKQQHGIGLWAIPRKDTRGLRWPPPFKRQVNKLRRRIETAFSVLQTVFHIQAPGSRSLAGLITRTASRLLAYTLCLITTMFFPMASPNSKTAN